MISEIAKISDIARIEPGFSTKGAISHDPDGTHQVIMGKHLVPGEPYYYVPEHELLISLDRPVDKYLLEPGDILFMSRGGSNYPVVLKEIPQPAIAPSTFCVVRASQGVDPDFLAWVMCQDPFQEQLRNIRVGSGTLMISKNGLENLMVPVPPLEMQKKIARLSELMQRERKLRRELREETGRLQMALGRKILLSITDSKSVISG